MEKSDITIRSIKLSDLNGVMRLSTEQGWNQTAADWKMMIENQQNYCLLAEWHGKIIGTTTAINYGQEVAWISMVLVDKEHRGYGISKLLLEAIFQKLTMCNSIKLDATPEGQPVYQKYNFIEEHFIVRMTCDEYNPLSRPDHPVLLQPILPKDIPDINALDIKTFGANRYQFIEYLLSLYSDRAWMLKRNHSIEGFVLGRAGRKYNHIGPVMATSAEDAKMLILKSLSKLNHTAVVVDVLADKTEIIAWFASIGFSQQQTFARMYRHTNPFPGRVDHQYLIGGPEFG